MLTDLPRTDLPDAHTPAPSHLIARQLELRPDSRILSREEALQWANSSPGIAACLALALTNPSVVFYECGRQADGTYMWRGARYGMGEHEYFSGFC